MNEVITLIEHLLKTKSSIDRLESICKQLNIDNDRLFKLIRAERYQEYFQWLRPDTHRKHQGGKLALTLDLFCCTHYAQQCKNQACPFLHLCPYNIRPMHGKCTNKNCPYDHEVSSSAHNKKIISTRGLAFIPDAILLEIARASADPSRSFWACTDHGKKGGCSKKSQCDKLHYCYYALTDACTKHYCPHEINDACTAYFRQKEIIDQVHDDILDAFQKVLRQRKTDFLKTVRVPPHPTLAQNACTVVTVAQQNPVSFEQEFPSLHSPIRSSLSATAPAYNGPVATRSSIVPEQETDLILSDSLEHDDTAEIELHLTEEIGYPIKLLSSKTISSTRKALSNLSQRDPATHYFCPIENPTELFRLLRWQNSEKATVEPLVVYANARDAHEATELNIEHNHFCLLRLHLLHGNLINGHSLQLDDPSPVYFDRMWVYVYDG